jgi:ketosteroid isomerase-like protein
MSAADSPEALTELIERYNDAWNRQDVAAIDSMHAPDIVFHNHTAGESVAGSGPVREHIAGIFKNWPGMRFTGRTLYVREALVVQEWTATGTHAESGRSATWDGMDILPTRDGLFVRKDVYSDSVSVMRQLGRL